LFLFLSNVAKKLFAVVSCHHPRTFCAYVFFAIQKLVLSALMRSAP
jgi:hypothetical protein